MKKKVREWLILISFALCGLGMFGLILTRFTNMTLYNIICYSIIGIMFINFLVCYRGE